MGIEQLDIFSSFLQPYPLGKKPIRLIEAFAGIGSQLAACERLGLPVEQYKILEWEYHAVLSYDAMHHRRVGVIEMTNDYMAGYLYDKGISSDGKSPMTKAQVRKLGKQLRPIYEAYRRTNNLGSICNAKGSDLGIVDTDKIDYIFTYSFPCQDLSLAGKQKGLEKGSGTRSSLLWEVERLLDECAELGKDHLPQILLMENVPQVFAAKNMPAVQVFIEHLASLGYNNLPMVLNAKEFGIPQNRNRAFLLSILGEYSMTAPQPIELEIVMKDCLDDTVDEKYYLSDKAVEGLISQMGKNTDRH